MTSLPMPNVVVVAGKKRSGKDTFCDSLAPDGFVKVHIAETWLREWFEARGMNPDEWETLKSAHREAIQRDATIARAEDELVVVRRTMARINELHAEGKRVAVTAVRFNNEALWAIRAGFLVVQVEVDDEVRRERFQRSGESLALFDDPFEADLGPDFPCHLTIDGNQNPLAYPIILSAGFTSLHGFRAQALAG